MEILNLRNVWPRIGLSLLALSLVVLFSARVQDARAGVDAAFNPDVHVELQGDGFHVTWVTDTDEPGFVEWALSEADLDGEVNTYTTTTDFRTAGLSIAFANYQNKMTHYVETSGLTPGASNTVWFRLVSGGAASQKYSKLLPSTLLGSPPRAAIGTVRDEAGNVMPECVVNLRVTQIVGGFPTYSLWANAVAGADGIFSKDVFNVREDPKNTIPGIPQSFWPNDFDSAFSYTDNSTDDFITVRARCSPELEGETTKSTFAAERPGGGTTGSYINIDVVVKPTPKVSINDVVVNEDDGTAVLTISISPTSTNPVTVTYNTVEGTATANPDFTSTTDSTTIAANATSTTISIPILPDAEEESDEQFTVVLSNPTGGAELGDSSGTVTILANDLMLAIDDLTVDEAVGNANAVIKIGQPSGSNISVQYNTSDGTASSVAGADYTSTTAMATILAGTTSTTTVIPINDDALDEDNETFTVTLSGAPAGVTIADASATVTITDNDALPALSIAAATAVAEAAGNASVQVTLNPVSGRQVTFRYSSADGTATGGGQDYDTQANVLGTIAAGATTTNLLIPITPDAIDEDDPESFTVTIGTPTDATLGAAQGTVNINDDDNPPNVSVAPAVSVIEGTAGTTTADVLVSLASASERDVVVTYKTVDGTATSTLAGGNDYVGVASNTVTISASQTSGTIKITVFGDTDVEGAETFIVEITDARSNGDTSTIVQATSTVTIIEKPTFSIEDPTVNESDGTATLTITLNPTSTSQTSVQYKTVEGTAKAGSDYTAVPSGGPVIFQPGDTSKTIQIPIVPDTYFELQEVFTVELFNNTPIDDTVINPNKTSAAVTITDDSGNQPKIVVSVNTADDPVTEGANVTVGLTITNQSAAHNQPIVVTYSTADGPVEAGEVGATAGTDYVAVTNATATIPAQSKDVKITIDIVNDLDFEDPETFAVNLTDAEDLSAAIPSDVPDIVTSTAKVTIEDDDIPPTVSVKKDVTVIENAGPAVLTLTMSHTTPLDVIVAYKTADATATDRPLATADVDYTSTTATTTISGGNLTTTVPIAITDDAKGEASEIFNFVLTGATNGIVTTTAAASAEVTILDDDPDAKVVTITSEGDAHFLPQHRAMGEARPGDQFFLVVAAEGAVGTPTLTNPVTTGGVPSNTQLMSIANIPPILVKMHNLGMVRGKTATHVWLAKLPDSSPQGQIDFVFSVGGTATLDVVGFRTNRNYFLFPGLNYTGLGLVPAEKKIENVLKQVVLNASSTYADSVKTAKGRGIWLQDVVETVYAFKFDTAGGFLSYSSPNPLDGLTAGPGGLTDLAPFQGMLVTTRKTAFDRVNVAGFTGMKPVPIKMTIKGPFLRIVKSTPEPISKQMRVGWNLVAPHTLRPASHESVFGGDRGLVARALSFEKRVMAMPQIMAQLETMFNVTFPTPGLRMKLLDPAFSYWAFVVLAKEESVNEIIRPIMTPADAE